MSFHLYEVLTNPFFLVFVTVVAGLWFGEWKRMGKCRLGVSGPLFVGLIVGWGVYRYAIGVPPESPAYSFAQNLIKNNVVPSMLQNFVLILFIAAIGLLASKDLRFVLKKYGIKFIFLGFIITLSGALMSYSTTLFNANTDKFEASGVYTGALTSSPGLGAALESSEKYALSLAKRFPAMDVDEQRSVLALIDSTGTLTPQNTQTLTDDQKNQLMVSASGKVGTGYAVSYPFGVISVILGIMLIPKIFKLDVAREFARYRAEMDQLRAGVPQKETAPIHFDLKSYALVCMAGYLLGSVEINMGSMGVFSLGSTGGVLIISVLCGYIGKIGCFSFRMSEKTLGASRDLALGLYLGMVGLTYGYRVVQAIQGAGIYLALSSLLIGIISVLIGYLVGRRLFGLNWILLSGAICGGMTSTPGLGVASNMLDSDEVGAGYAAAYPSALIGMVLFTILMYNLG